MRILGALLILFGAVVASPAFADDWIATKLRGVVLELVDDDWRPLARGAIVPDDRVVRTVKGRVTFKRGGETIELGDNTQIQIFDEAGAKPFTTVKQYFGEVAVEAEVRDIQHFAVQTPYLAAVIKGTKFVVTSDEDTSVVAVNRGSVDVRSRTNGSHVLIGVGQSASISSGGSLEVSGEGDLPTVLDMHGNVVPDNDAGKPGKDPKEPKVKEPKKPKAPKEPKAPKASDNLGNSNSGSLSSGKGKGKKGKG